MDAFRSGDGARGHQLQDEFLAEFHAQNGDHCSCRVPCKHHGHCKDCVAIHRAHGDHLPNCFHEMFNRKLKLLSELSEHSLYDEIEETHGR
jgi:hypothetical protein